MRSLRGWPACVVAVLAAGMVFAAAESGGAAGARSDRATTASGALVPRLLWRACTGKGQEGFQCARARVPLDHRYPRGARRTSAAPKCLSEVKSRSALRLFRSGIAHR